MMRMNEHYHSIIKEELIVTGMFSSHESIFFRGSFWSCALTFLICLFSVGLFYVKKCVVDSQLGVIPAMPYEKMLNFHMWVLHFSQLVIHSLDPRSFMRSLVLHDFLISFIHSLL